MREESQCLKRDERRKKYEQSRAAQSRGKKMERSRVRAKTNFAITSDEGNWVSCRQGQEKGCIIL